VRQRWLRLSGCEARQKGAIEYVAEVDANRTAVYFVEDAITVDIAVAGLVSDRCHAGRSDVVNKTRPANEVG